MSKTPIAPIAPEENIGTDIDVGTKETQETTAEYAEETPAPVEEKEEIKIDKTDLPIVDLPVQNDFEDGEYNPATTRLKETWVINTTEGAIERTKVVTLEEIPAAEIAKQQEADRVATIRARVQELTFLVASKQATEIEREDLKLLTAGLRLF